jgi:hypothetical protein
VIAEIYRKGEVLDQRTEGSDVVISARVGQETAGRLARFIAA